MSGARYGGYLFASGRLARSASPLTVTAHISLACAVTFAGLGAATGRVGVPGTPAHWGVVLAMPLIPALVALPALAGAVRRIGATRASLLVTTDPLWATLFTRAADAPSALLLSRSTAQRLCRPLVNRPGVHGWDECCPPGELHTLLSTHVQTCPAICAGIRRDLPENAQDSPRRLRRKSPPPGAAPALTRGVTPQARPRRRGRTRNHEPPRTPLGAP